MNSRARVLAAVNHKQPDRTPVDLLMAPETADNLMRHLGLHSRAEVLQWAGQDMVLLGPTFTKAATPKCYADPTIEVTPEGLHLDIYRVPFREACDSTAR